MQKFYRDKVTAVFLFTALIFVGLAVVGIIRSYSPVPFWDMWDGYLGFYTKINFGDWGAWWAQHNEHRILLTRLFFWIDIAWFAGAGWFLLLVNFLLLVCICLLFWQIWREQSSQQYPFFGFFLVAWLFSWQQNENLTWGFQIQFFLAQLLPLAAFYSLHRATNVYSRPIKTFLVATMFGILSIGSMANGVLVLPLMMFYAILVGLGHRRIFFLALLSVACLWAYFHDYVSPGGHGSLSQALQENPLGVVHYILLYLGGPFFYMLGHVTIAQQIATIAGGFFTVCFAFIAWLNIRHPTQCTLPMALLMFILYIGGTALGAAGGRLVFGVHQALSSRYMTSSLIAWAALFLLSLPYLHLEKKTWNRNVWKFFLFLLLLMLFQQFGALSSKKDVLFEKNIAALALELGVNDQIQIGNIYPSAELALSRSEVPVAQNISIFGLAPFKNLRKTIGMRSRSEVLSGRECRGCLDFTEPIDGDDHYLRIQGWFFDPATNSVPELINLINKQGSIVGFALTGQFRPDVGKVVASAAKDSGFKGYLLTDTTGQQIFLVEPKSRCHIAIQIPAIQIPAIFYKITKMAPAMEWITASSKSVQFGNEWLGGDFYKSHFNGMVVLGSFINSDADTGTIKLKIKRGDKLFYRSGPTGGRQLVEVLNTQLPVLKLPVALDWVQLDFSSDLLPKIFTLKFSDNGKGWGEWSAIALKMD